MPLERKIWEAKFSNKHRKVEEEGETASGGWGGKNHTLASLEGNKGFYLDNTKTIFKKP